MPNLLIIGHTFPEPKTTAAGSRMLQLIALFQEMGYSLHFGSTASRSKYSEPLEALFVETHALQLNSESFDLLLRELQPEIVVYDRFITEEQFGWKVSEVCPKALTILDTEDLHFLRKARKTAFEQGIAVSRADVYTESAKREVASILRCDLSLIISEVECELLVDTFDVPRELLWYLPFLVDVEKLDFATLPTYRDRNDFIVVGNLKHSPNVASIKLLKHELWPKIKVKLPDAVLKIYGAYVPQQVQEMHDHKQGFLIMGWAENITHVMQHAKVQLAPLPFGAGLKGKLLDAMQQGLPTVTTHWGAEGMYDTTLGLSWVCDDWEAFVIKAAAMYSRQDVWKMASEQGLKTVESRFDRRQYLDPLKKKLSHLLLQLETHRKQHFIGQILQHHTLQTTKYMSKWIAAKQPKP